MSGSRVAVFANALLLLTMMMLLLAFDAPAQDAPTPAPQPQASAAVATQEVVHSKSTLRGHVSYEGTGRPVRRARLMLLAKGNRGTEMTGVTNSHGDFQIKNVSEGKYFIMVDAAGVVTPLSLVDFEMLKNEKPNYDEVSKQFEEISIDGINDKEVEVRARRGGAISGRVAYQDGDPAINVRVTILRRRDGELKQFLTSMSPAAIFGYQTDDRGFYRFSGLPPGEYVVGATENIEHGDPRHNIEDDFMGAALFGGNSLVMTYYQDATSARNATTIKIEAGEEEKNIDITISDRALHTISGTVRARRGGRPLARAHVSLTTKEKRQGPSQVIPYEEFLPNSETDEMGQWSFNEIPDGDYVINVQPAYEAPEPTTVSEESKEVSPALIVSHNKKKFSTKQQAVKVAGRDVTDLVVELTEGARITGTVTVEGGKPFPSSVFITAQPPGEELAVSSPWPVNSDGSFMVDGLPSGKLYLYAYSPDKKYYAKSMIADGLDLLREPLLVQESAEIKDVRVILSADGGTLTGRVLTSQGGPPLSNSGIMLYPADSSLWALPGRVIFEETDDLGEFNISAAPGEYLFLVVRNGEKAQGSREEFIKSRAATAPHVTLQANEQKSMEIIAPGAK
jgi:hypothetical protein